MLKDFFIRNYIRSTIRKLRNEINKIDKKNYSFKITKQVLQYTSIKKSKNIALFLSFDGEIDTSFLIMTLWSMNINVYLPLLDFKKKNNLIFVKYQYNTLLIKNKLNIFEPCFNIHQVITIDCLDIVFIPLVAFNKYGDRLGMGGGFYDRILKNWKYNNFYPIGLAYNFQLVDYFPIFYWDVPLPMIITPNQFWLW